MHEASRARARASSAIHLGLWIVPIYPLAATVDFLIFNNIEFLTGEPVFK